MGAIIYWGLVRFAVVVIVAWAAYGFVPNYGDWWTLFFVAIGVIVVYPAQLAWRKQEDTIRSANQNGLCATCKHFARREALCTRLDEHVRQDYTPCGGEGWEPLGNDEG